MTRIYTKTGDDGTTGMIGGRRVSKDAERMEACGVIDELSAVFGLVSAFHPSERIHPVLFRIQNDLFRIGADLALVPGTDCSGRDIPSIAGADIEALEREIDACEALLPPLKCFLLPGGSSVGALLHFARSVARRAERRCVKLARNEKVDPQIICYLNRLSDLCFVLARLVNHEQGQPEAHPASGKPGDR
jgi:cob(I)alamin adenosyltransferase